jgi:hypothetical protein
LGTEEFFGNKFSITKVETTSDNSVTIRLTFKDGPADALSYPYLIATIPKLSSMKFIFIEETP